MEELIGWVLLAIFVVAAGRVGYLIYQNNRYPEQAAASAATARRDPHGETGPMIYFANDAHGRADREYQFNYKWVYDGSLHAYTWRACILRMPCVVAPATATPPTAGAMRTATTGSAGIRLLPA